MGAWVWFLVAAVAGVAGGALLLVDRGQLGLQGRERRRWAGLRGWQFADANPQLTGNWRHGVLGRDAGGDARNVVTGSLFTAAGRRQVHVFDLDRGPGSMAVLVAVRRRDPHPVVLEMWLPTAEFPADAELDLLGPVGDRFAFTSDLVRARPLITPELAELADDVGDDVPVVWVEDAWVVAAAGRGTTPTRLERLLRLLGDLADLVDGVPVEEVAARAAAADQPRRRPPSGPRDRGGPEVRPRRPGDGVADVDDDLAPTDDDLGVAADDHDRDAEPGVTGAAHFGGHGGVSRDRGAGGSSSVFDRVRGVIRAARDRVGDDEPDDDEPRGGPPPRASAGNRPSGRGAAAEDETAPPAGQTGPRAADDSERPDHDQHPHP